MKTLFAILLTGICIVASQPAFGQVQATRIGTFDNLPSIITDTATSNVVSTAVTVRQGRGMAVLPYFNATNSAANENVIFNFEVSADGTNWSTSTAFSLTNTLNGATAVRGFHLLSAATLDNVRQIRLQSIENAHTNSIWITNVMWSVGN